MIKKGVCKHFNGIMNKLCRSDLDMRDITGGDGFGWTKRMPCFAVNNATCDKYSEPTEEEVSAEKKEWDDKIKEITLLFPLISAYFKA